MANLDFNILYIPNSKNKFCHCFLPLITQPTSLLPQNGNPTLKSVNRRQNCQCYRHTKSELFPDIFLREYHNTSVLGIS